MSGRSSRYCSVPSLAVLTGSLLLAGNGRAGEPPHGRPIEFSDPKSAEITTNLSQLSAKRGDLRDLEVDLTKWFQQGFSSRSSLDGIAEQQIRYYSPAPVMRNKKVKELLEREKNWALMSPEDLTRGPTPEEIFNLPEYGPDGKEKKKVSAVERFYERQELDKRAVPAKRDRDRDSEDLFTAHRHGRSHDNTEPRDPTALSGELNESERALRRALADSKQSDNLSAPDSSQGNFSDIFKMGNNTSAFDQSDAQKAYKKAYREQFEKLLDPSTLGSATAQFPSSLSSVLDPSSVAPIPAFDQAQASSRSTAFDFTSGAFGSPLQPTGLSDATAKAVNPWNAPSFPKAEQPKSTSPASLLDFVPKRNFP